MYNKIQDILDMIFKTHYNVVSSKANRSIVYFHFQGIKGLHTKIIPDTAGKNLTEGTKHLNSICSY